MSVASKLLKTIDERMRADQGAAYKAELRSAIAACEDAYSPDIGQRSHLGASGLGNPCSRALWYGFRWVGKAGADARMLRIWNRGHLEEGRFVAILRSVGVKVWTHTDDGKQFRINIFGAHAGGSCDGGSLNVPDCPTIPLLNEFKTHKDSSFSDLFRKGVKDSKPTHYIQMMLYMRRLYTQWGLYFAVNKDTDALHAEIIAYDEATDVRYTQRAEYIVTTPVPPERVSNNPSWYVCKFCDFREVCHDGKEVARNCRTCEFVRVRADGWYCGYPRNADHSPITKAIQQEGCDWYRKLAALSHA